MSNYTEITDYMNRYSAKITEISTDIYSMKTPLQALKDFSETELAKLIKEALSIKNDNKGILRSKDIVYKIREEKLDLLIMEEKSNKKKSSFNQHERGFLFCLFNGCCNNLSHLFGSLSFQFA